MIRFAFMPVWIRRCAIVVQAALALQALALVQPAIAAAQDSAEPSGVSHAVVEPTAPSAGRALNAALGRLAKDPRNVDALLEAGNAAIALGDNDAALGFFTRADQVSPGNARVKLAIAQARLNLDNPVDALRWYADAERLGADPAGFAADRGLAYDLAGDNAAAIAQYRRVVDGTADSPARDEAIRRKAVSLAIGGDRRGADLALLPLLQRQDRAAWRAHIFVLAIAGRGDEAVSVAHATMPPDLAASVGPYLRFMVRLTPAQQAAAASLGRFPRAADVGRDDPAVMAYTAAHPRVPLTPAPAPVAALASAAQVAKDARGDRAKRRHGNTPAPPVMVAGPVVPPEIVLPAPPPPPVLAAITPPRAAVLASAAPTAGKPAPPPVAASVAPPVAPAASRTTTPSATFDLAQIAKGGAAPAVVVATAPARTVPPPAPGVPRPPVLSLLDLPPAPRPAVAARTAVAPTPAPAVVVAAAAPPVIPAPVVVAPIAPPAAPASVPAATAVVPVATAAVAEGQHAVVQPVPAAPAKPADIQAPPEKPAISAGTSSKPATAKAVAVKTVPEKAAPDKAAPDKVGADKVGADKASRAGSGRIPPGKDKSASDADAGDTARAADKTSESKSSQSKSGQSKSGKARAAEPKPTAKAEQNADSPKAGSKAARDEALKRALAPCKPTTPGKAGAKSRKGKAATDTRASKKSSESRSKSAKGGKSRKTGKADVADSETCDSTAQGDRPDAPGGVSRDSDTPADSKGKTKAATTGKGRGKNGDAKTTDKDAKAADKDAEAAKPGRHARYASRIWVQVLTAGDRDKIPGEWRNLVRKARTLKGHKPYLTPWRSNFRLLTGPFDSDADAQDFIAELRKDGVAGFEWTSPAGQAVDTMALP